MPRSRFVTPRLRTLPISEGDSITVRERLTHGEQQAAYGRMYTRVDGKLTVDPLRVGVALIIAYLVDWTLTDESGAIVLIRGLALGELVDVIDNLEPETVREIRQAIEAHEQAMIEEREKKMIGERELVGTSG